MRTGVRLGSQIALRNLNFVVLIKVIFDLSNIIIFGMSVRNVALCLPYGFTFRFLLELSNFLALSDIPV